MLFGETRDTLLFVARCFLTLLSNTCLHVLVQCRSNIWSCSWAVAQGVPTPVQRAWPSLLYHTFQMPLFGLSHQQPSFRNNFLNRQICFSLLSQRPKHHFPGFCCRTERIKFWSVKTDLLWGEEQLTEKSSNLHFSELKGFQEEVVCFLQSLVPYQH